MKTGMVRICERTSEMCTKYVNYFFLYRHVKHVIYKYL